MNRTLLAPLVIGLLLFFSLSLAAQTPQQFTLLQISIDKFTNSDSVHRTEVEPDSFAWGSTVVTTYHVARRPGATWGSADIGFSTSTDGGKTGTYGYLPGLTVNYDNGPYGAASDPAVAYDAKHGVWMISSLPLVGLNENSGKIGDVAVSRSTDGIHWGSPVIVDDSQLDDKDWIVCDNTSTSPYYGNCYTEWDQAFGTGDVLMSTSSDGGQTWSPGQPTADDAFGLGGEPLVQPNGTVIVPFQGTGINAFTSTNGGKSWNRSELVANIEEYPDPDDIRNPDLPAATIDAAGNVYVLWSDCRFRTNCSTNDIVMSTTADGTHWTSPVRIPIDPLTSNVDHFLPGIGADPATSGTTAHLTIVYYYYPVANCSSNCQLDVGFTSSDNGGNTWTSGVQLAGPMQITWLPLSDDGYMVADYIGVSYINGNPLGVFAVAKAPNGSTLNEAMYTTKEPLLPSADARRFSSSGEEAVAKSNYVRTLYYDDEGTRPIPASRLKAAENKK